jgi:hypothetical protein
MEKPQGAGLKRVGNLIVFAIAILYFLLDAIFATVAVPLSRWIGAHRAFARIHRWILSLRPYPTLALFVVPLIILEPAKPAAAYLVGTGHALLGLVILAGAEILKIVLIERLFSISRDKLLSIPAFAWGYGKYSVAKGWLTSLEAWQRAVRWGRVARNTAHRLATQLRDSPRQSQTYKRCQACLPIAAMTARRERQRV